MTKSQTPRCSATPNSVHVCGGMEKQIVVCVSSAPPPPPSKVQTHSFSRCEVRCLLCSHQFCTFMWSQPCGEHAGAACWRRERRLRQFLRHERLSVAVALAESLHHAATRGQKMATAGGVEREENYEPMPLDPPLPGGSRGRLGSPLHTVACGHCGRSAR